MTFVQRRPVTFFLVAAVAITYLAGPVAYFALRALQGLAGTALPGVNDLVMKFGPSLAGLLTVALAEGGRGVKDLLRRCVRWRAPVYLYLFALLVPALVVLAVLLARGDGAEVRDVGLQAALRAFGVQLLLAVLLGGGLAEEVGWRGFMLPQLCRRSSPLAATLFVSIAWFSWHVPAYVFLNKGAADPILPFAVIVFPLSIVLTWAYLRSGGSVLLPILLHGSLNASFYTLVELLPRVAGATDFQPGFDWTVAACWTVLAAIVLAASGLRLGANSRGNTSDRSATGA